MGQMHANSGCCFCCKKGHPMDSVRVFTHQKLSDTCGYPKHYQKVGCPEKKLNWFRQSIQMIYLTEDVQKKNHKSAHLPQEHPWNVTDPKVPIPHLTDLTE